MNECVWRTFRTRADGGPDVKCCVKATVCPSSGPRMDVVAAMASADAADETLNRTDWTIETI